MLLPPTANRLFLDVGANDGIEMSSTYLLEQNGWKGLLVEPNLKLLDSLTTHRSSPVLVAGVSDDSAITMMATSDSCSTLGTLCSAKNSFSMKRLQETSTSPLFYQPTSVVSTEQLVEFFRANFDSYPSFIKVDVEGLETKVITSLLSSCCRPPIIEIENNERASSPGDLLIQEGYSCNIVLEGFVEIWTNLKIPPLHRVIKLFSQI